MKADVTIPKMLDRAATLDARRILRDLQHKLEKLIARHHQEQKLTTGRSTAPASSRKRRNETNPAFSRNGDSGQSIG